MKDLSHDNALRCEAAPYVPPLHPQYEFAIFNDGTPSMTAPTEADVSRILHGIQDEALDETFPPDAGEAAELEDVERFVEMQALLALMEERDQEARVGFRHIKKRWEVRRREGLPAGRRPKAAPGSPTKTMPQAQAHHGMNLPMAKHAPRSHVPVSTAMVPYQHHCHRLMLEKAMQRNQMMRDAPKHMLSKHRAAPRLMGPIQQPRKQT